MALPDRDPNIETSYYPRTLDQALADLGHAASGDNDVADSLRDYDAGL